MQFFDKVELLLLTTGVKKWGTLLVLLFFATALGRRWGGARSARAGGSASSSTGEPGGAPRALAINYNIIHAPCACMSAAVHVR